MQEHSWYSIFWNLDYSSAMIESFCMTYRTRQGRAWFSFRVVKIGYLKILTRKKKFQSDLLADGSLVHMKSAQTSELSSRKYDRGRKLYIGQSLVWNFYLSNYSADILKNSVCNSVVRLENKQIKWSSHRRRKVCFYFLTIATHE